MSDDHDFRTLDHVYELHSHPTYGFVVADGDAENVIAGIIGRSCILLRFELGGRLKEARSVAAAKEGKSSRSRPLSEGALLELVLERHGVEGAGLIPGCGESIGVRRFFVKELGVGIHDLYKPRKSMTAGNFRQWQEDGNYVFFWGHDLWIGGSGRAFAS